MIAATLWAGDASAISHESALVVYGLASAMPSVIHLTVPRSFTGARPGYGSITRIWAPTSGGCGTTFPSPRWSAP